MYDLGEAVRLLREGDFTCVLCGTGVMLTSHTRGVAPLLAFLDAKQNLRGCYAADKVVGKGAAFLYVLLGVRAVYATVISKSALEVLQRTGIDVSYDTLVPYIKNRTGDGRCPIELAVLDVARAEEALPLIRARLAELKKN